MNCKKIQEIILTDYLDREISTEQEKRLEEHLVQCSRCKKLTLVARRAVVEPFRKAEKAIPPGSLWQLIKEKIEAEEQQKTKPHPLADLMDKLKKFLYIPKPVFAVAIVMAVVLVSVTLTKLHIKREEIARIYQEEQIEYLLYSMGGAASTSIDEDLSYRTTIEEYFL